MYFWYAYFVWLTDCYVLGVFFSCCLTFRFNRIPKWIHPLIIIVASAVALYYKAKYSYDINSFEYKVFNLLSTAILISYVIICYKDVLWKKLMIFIFFVVAVTIGEISVRILSSVTGIKLDFKYNSIATVFYYAFDLLVSTFYLFIFALVWKKIMGKSMKLNNMGILILFPISQVMMQYYCSNKLYSNRLSENVLAIVTMIISIIVDMLIFYILMVQSEKQQLEKQLEECDQMRAIEKARYEEFEAKRTELAKFRHDYNNQLTTAILLEEQGNREMAGKMIKELRERVMG